MYKGFNSGSSHEWMFLSRWSIVISLSTTSQNPNLRPLLKTSKCCLSLYWNFLNYNLLQHMFNIFGDEQLKHDMEDNVEGLKVFRADTDDWPLRGQKTLKADPQELAIKYIMDKKWEECTLVFACRLCTRSQVLDTIIIHFIVLD